MECMHACHVMECTCDLLDFHTILGFVALFGMCTLASVIGEPFLNPRQLWRTPFFPLTLMASHTELFFDILPVASDFGALAIRALLYT